MRLRTVGEFSYKGSHGFYVEAVDLPQTEPRYAAIGFEFLEEQEIRALALGRVIESPVLEPDPDGWLHHRIEYCFP
jgi:hypothetical protein